MARTDILGQGVLHKAVLGGVLVAGNNTMPGGIGGEDDDMSLNKGRGGGLRGIAKGIIEPLLRCGICVDGKDAHGLSPLALAADYGVTGLISGTCSFHEKAMRFIALAVISIIQSTHPSIYLSNHVPSNPSSIIEQSNRLSLSLQPPDIIIEQSNIIIIIEQSNRLTLSLLAGCLAGLAELGADVDSRDEGGNTSLLIASLRGRVETLRTLLECGADLNR